MAMVESLYDILSVTHNASLDDIRKAYHRAARLHHPDKQNTVFTSSSNAIIQIANHQYTSKFHLIQTAYETLRDTEKRKKYDQELQQQDLIEKTQQSHAHISEEIHKENMRREELHNENGEVDILYSYNCRCGDQYEVFEDEIIDLGYLVVPCTGCSLNIRVVIESL